MHLTVSLTHAPTVAPSVSHSALTLTLSFGRLSPRVYLGDADAVRFVPFQPQQAWSIRGFLQVLVTSPQHTDRCALPTHLHMVEAGLDATVQDTNGALREVAQEQAAQP